LKLSKRHLKYLKQARVARLGTIDSKGRPHVVPVVFANSKSGIYFVVDRKRKTHTRLKRVENIERNSEATLLVDAFSEDWEKLSYLILHCKAKTLEPAQYDKERNFAASLLREKYAQYRTGDYFPVNPSEAIFVKLRPISASYWQNLRRSLL
jgi:PPOX class probable F420-dependent enzyme